MSWHSIKLVHRKGVEPFHLAFRGPVSALAADVLRNNHNHGVLLRQKRIQPYHFWGASLLYQDHNHGEFLHYCKNWEFLAETF